MHRADLLRELDPAFVAGLPVSPALSPQLLTDLHELNTTLRDGSVPIVHRLKSALLIVAPRPEAAAFEEALRRLGVSFSVGATSPRRG